MGNRLVFKGETGTSEDFVSEFEEALVAIGAAAIEKELQDWEARGLFSDPIRHRGCAGRGLSGSAAIRFGFDHALRVAIQAWIKELS